MLASNNLSVGSTMTLASGGTFNTPNKTSFTDNDNGFFMDTTGNFFLGDKTESINGFPKNKTERFN